MHTLDGSHVQFRWVDLSDRTRDVRLIYVRLMARWEGISARFFRVPPGTYQNLRAH